MQVTDNRMGLLGMIAMALCAGVALVSGIARGETYPASKPATTLAAPEGVFDDDAMPDKGAEPEKDSPVRVGVVVSHFTATGPSPLPRKYGFGHIWIADMLRHSAVDCYALVEPDAVGDHEQERYLARYFTPEKVLDGTDVDVLRQLDVIVFFHVFNLNDQMLASVHQAVSEGVGLLNVMAGGSHTPGRDSALVLDLMGLSDARGMAGNLAQEVEVVGDDPLLSAIPADAQWTCKPAGIGGTFKEGAVPLLRSRTADGSEPAEGEEFYPLYRARLGEGQLLVCNWYGLPACVKELEDEHFYVRCVRRLAALREAAPAAREPERP
ncbi:MAG: hypothetical protein H0T11_08745 [Chthoniobacterales bacterium]|nr:hypothetical protein [Chthoniobacterales bacterium]